MGAFSRFPHRLSSEKQGNRETRGIGTHCYKSNRAPIWILTDRKPTNNSETNPSVQSVSLVGSWDNFEQSYTMERDVRRDRGQWRGCYEFKNIICDGNRPATARRNGGLKMGQPYYYYVSWWLEGRLNLLSLFTDTDI